MVADIGKFQTDMNKAKLVEHLVANNSLLNNKKDKDIASNTLRSFRDKVIGNQVNKQLADFAQEKKSVDSIKGLSSILHKEQKYLADLYKGLKDKDPGGYSKSLKPILKSARNAYKNKSAVGRVLASVDKSVKNQGLPTKKALSLLCSKHDILHVGRKTSRAIEKHNIYGNLLQYKKDIDSAKKPKQIITTMKNKQQFLNKLNGSLKHDHHDPKIVTAMEKNLTHMDNKSINKLNHIMENNLKNKAMSETNMLKFLKKDTDPVKMHKQLVSAYHDNVIARANKDLHSMRAGGSIAYRGHNYDCPVEYFQKVIDHNKHTPYFPGDRMTKSLNKIENELQQQHQQEMKLNRNRNMGGPEM